jgi:hypothetical protein
MSLDSPKIGPLPRKRNDFRNEPSWDDVFHAYFSTLLGKSGYKDAMEHYLNSLNERDFKILERLDVTVAGETGDEVVYYYLAPHTDYTVARGKQPSPSVTRILIFMHNGLVW